MRIKYLLGLAAVMLTLAPGGSQAQTPAPYNDCSGTIIADGVAQTVLSDNVNRRYLFIENPTATVSGVAAESLFTNNDVAASAAGASDELVNNGVAGISSKVYSFPGYVPTGPVSMEAATLGHKFVCKWN